MENKEKINMEPSKSTFSSKKKDQNILNSVIRIMVSLLITGISISCIFFVIIPWYGMYDLQGMFLALVMVFIMLMSLRFYYYACKTSPGHPASDWVPKQEEIAILEKYSYSYKRQFKMKETKPVYFCEKCQCYKPVLSHHCRECKRCVLKQDHHCPWITNCVGYYNHHFFFLFLLYSSLGIYYVLALSTMRGISYFTDSPGSDAEFAGVISCLVITLVLSISLSILFIFQFGLVLSNTTTIESTDFLKKQRSAKKKKLRFKYQYDFGGYLKNFYHNFGTKSLFVALFCPPYKTHFDYTKHLMEYEKSLVV